MEILEGGKAGMLTEVVAATQAPPAPSNAVRCTGLMRLHSLYRSICCVWKAGLQPDYSSA